MSQTVLFNVKDLEAPSGGWLVRIVPPGERFGLKNDLINGSILPLVEFYDPRHPHTALGGSALNAGDYGPHHEGGIDLISLHLAADEEPLRGQFVSRYDLRTFLQAEGGINLDGGIPDWKIGAEALVHLQQSVLAFTSDYRKTVIREELEGMNQDEVLDRLGDALHEAADGLGIPEGPGRDFWRLARMQDAGIDSENENFLDDVAGLMAQIEYARGDLAHLYPDDPEEDVEPR